MGQERPQRTAVIVIAKTFAEAAQYDLRGSRAIVTPRSSLYGVRGLAGVRELVITAAMVDHTKLHDLIAEVAPAFATTRRETTP